MANRKPLVMNAGAIEQLQAADALTGVNITSGADPGHTHTGASLGSIDISADTNLAVTAPIVLTDDTLSFAHLGIESLTDPGGDRIMFWDDVGAAATTWLVVSTGLQITTTNLTTNDGEIVHADLSGYDANEHIDHTGVSISPGVGLSGGGTIASTRTLTLDINGLDADTIVAADTIAFYDATGSHVNKTTFTDFKTALAIHAEAHSIASHNDTAATGAELNTLTDNSVANTLHRHSELVASDGTPDPALAVDAVGAITIGGALAVTGAITGPNVSSGADPGHTHTGYSADEKIKVDASATADYLGAAAGDGALRVGTGISYVDGGNFVTLDLDVNSLTGEPAIVTADTIPFYDATAAANRKVTLGELQTAIGFANTAIKVYLSGVQSIGSGSEVVVEFDSEVFDPGNNFNTTTHRYTVPSTGYYLISINFRMEPGVDQWVAAWATQGATEADRLTYAFGQSTNSLIVIKESSASVEYLVASSYVELIIRHNTGGAENLLAEIYHTNMSIARVA